MNARTTKKVKTNLVVVFEAALGEEEAAAAVEEATAEEAAVAVEEEAVEEEEEEAVVQIRSPQVAEVPREIHPRSVGEAPRTRKKLTSTIRRERRKRRRRRNIHRTKYLIFSSLNKHLSHSQRVCRSDSHQVFPSVRYRCFQSTHGGRVPILSRGWILSLMSICH